MAIRKIKVSNFKGFKDLDVELSKFNVLIGRNASGKSNFVQILQFLRDIVNHGLDNAISMQGGTEYLTNINLGLSKEFSAMIVYDVGEEEESALLPWVRIRKRSPAWLKVLGTAGTIRNLEMTYEFSLNFNREGSGFEIGRDKLTQKIEFVTSAYGKERKKLGEGEIILSSANGKVDIELHKPEEITMEKEEIYPLFWREQHMPANMLLLQTAHPYFSRPLMTFFRDISIYDFDPKLPKKATPISGKADLEEDGSNLAIVLQKIIANDDRKRKLSNLLADLLPFISDFGVEKFADKSLLFKLRESYSVEKYLPASLLSDGTINIIGLIVALYFERKLLTIIEEPERNMHPSLIFKVVGMLKEASEKKQILVTTHNPELVRHADLESILLVSRNKEGFSIITRPYEKDTVKVFLKNEIGIHDLYVEDLLE